MAIPALCWMLLSGMALTVWLPLGVPAAWAGPAGDPERGRAIFADKGCARCHLPDGQTGAAPSVGQLRRAQGEMALAGRLWNHAPSMAARMAQTGLEWPRMTVGEMADLMSYLLADPRRDPEPNLLRGQGALVRQGCLKCHSLRGEGGRVRPDLGEARADYESGSAWAAAMWTHTPRMADLASSMGVSYPRFVDDEMGHLVGYLRSVAGPAGKAPAR
jgi:mono/diheme cytochrome c family protein